MCKKILFFVSFLVPLIAFATHQRAGEITYEHISGLTYRFTIITYTYTPSDADRPELEFSWGDGTTTIVERYSKVNIANDISINTYITEHTFPSTGTFSITLEDANRNAGIVNIPNSVNIPFFIETTLIINPFLGANSSPRLLNPPIDNGCTGVPFYHNPGAYDADGDSLSYSLIVCRGFDGENIPGYSYPMASNFISIDAVTGDLTWDSPIWQGEYNVAILIREWRNGVLMGTVLRDMQISIVACDNEPPVINTIIDTCVEAGTLLQFNVIGDDPNSSAVTLSATGGVFELATSPATFTSVTDEPPIQSLFSWQTVCNHVILPYYNVLFKITDNGPQVNLTAFKTVHIKVVAPKPENPVATPVGNEIHVSWDLHVCQNVAGYKIYRRAGEYNFTPDVCETGLPAYTGYQLIGTTNEYADVAFIDDGSILPLNHGTEYCYRIVAFFDDGAESYVSDEVCTILQNDVPALTNVDIENTDITNGTIFLKWLVPTEFDTIQYPGPHYEYHIWRAVTHRPADFRLIATTLSLYDTTYTDINLNTNDSTYFYKVTLFSEVADTLVEVGTSDPASSIHLTITPLDRSLQLSWTERVPWMNTEYRIYRLNENLHQFDSIATTHSLTFVDRNLNNGQTYCYYVMAVGGYFAPDTIAPFFNRSQQCCAVPTDITPPEIPTVVVTTDCEQVDFEFYFSHDSAYLDVSQYYIYYKPTYDAEYVRIDSFYTDESCYMTHCTYQLTGLPYITGCFAMAAIDTVGNLSELSEATCFDTDFCSPYILPNIFTPNGDGYNDILQPFPYDNVQAVDFYLYNRWGRLVFKTTDIDINWDGTDIYSKRPSSDGTYYYVCEVSLYSLTGIVKKQLNGTISLIR